MTEREEITEYYLFLALEELATHRGTIKRSRALLWNWRNAICNIGLKDFTEDPDLLFEEFKRLHANKEKPEEKPKIKLNIKTK